MKNQQLTDQYDSLYEAPGFMYGEGEPLKSVTKLVDYLKEGSALDIGGGEGRNALYLAAHGFKVEVLDLSRVGLDKLITCADKKDLHIKTKVTDVVESGIYGTYDAIVMSFVLHHINTDDAVNLIKDSQSHTTDGGIHIIANFSAGGELYERSKKSGRFYPTETVLGDLYVDWDIKELVSRETTTRARHKDGTRMKNSMVVLIAQKI